MQMSLYVNNIVLLTGRGMNKVEWNWFQEPCRLW